VLVEFVKAWHGEKFDVQNAHASDDADRLEYCALLTNAENIQNYGELPDYITKRLDVLFKICTVETKVIACTQLYTVFQKDHPRNPMQNAPAINKDLNRANLFTHLEMHKIDIHLHAMGKEIIQTIPDQINELQDQLNDTQDTNDRKAILLKIAKYKASLQQWIRVLPTLTLRIASVPQNARIPAVGKVIMMPFQAVKKIASTIITMVNPFYPLVLYMAPVILGASIFAVALTWFLYWSNMSWWKDWLSFGELGAAQEPIQLSEMEGVYYIQQVREVASLNIPTEVTELHTAQSISFVAGLMTIKLENVEFYTRSVLNVVQSFLPLQQQSQPEALMVHGIPQLLTPNNTELRDMTAELCEMNKGTMDPVGFTTVIDTSIRFFASMLKPVLIGDVLQTNFEVAAKQRYLDLGTQLYMSNVMSQATLEGLGDASIQKSTVDVLSNALTRTHSTTLHITIITDQIAKEKAVFEESKTLFISENSGTAAQQIEASVKLIMDIQNDNVDIVEFLRSQSEYTNLAVAGATRLLNSYLPEGSTAIRQPGFFKRVADTTTSTLKNMASWVPIFNTTNTHTEHQVARFTELSQKLNELLEDKKMQTDRLQTVRATWLQVCYWTVFKKWLYGLRDTETYDEKLIGVMIELAEFRESVSVWKMARYVYTTNRRDQSLMHLTKKLNSILKESTGEHLENVREGHLTVTNEMIDDMSILQLGNIKPIADALIDLAKKMSYEEISNGVVVADIDTKTYWQKTLEEWVHSANKVADMRKTFILDAGKLKALKEENSITNDESVQSTACAADIIEDRVDLRHMCAANIDAHSSDNTTHPSHIRQNLRILASTGCSVSASGCSNSGSNMRMRRTLVSSSGSLAMGSSTPSCSGTRPTQYRGHSSKY
jgi:hypothetical protein